jgi:hypothetical protein
LIEEEEINMNLEQELIKLRKISHNWEDLDEVYETLKDVKRFFRNGLIMTDDLFDVYDDIILSIVDIEESVEVVLFDGRIFTSVLTRFGFKDFSRDDYANLI